MKHSHLVLSLIAALPAFARQEPAQPVVREGGEPPRATASGAAAKGTVVSEVSRACWYVFQAKNGDYWFGSDGQGVYRWGGDGAKLINYTTADGLAGNGIRGIQGDKAGNVYFCTWGGISKFDGRVFSTLPVVEGGGADGGWRLHPDDLWFQWFKGMPTPPGPAGTEGPYRYDGTTLYQLKLPKSDLDAESDKGTPPNARWSSYDVYSIYRDSRGHMWIGTGLFGVCRYDGKSFGWLYEKHLQYAPNGGSFGTRAVIEDKDGAFWINNTTYRFRVEPENKDGKVPHTREAGIDVKALDGDVMYFQGAEPDAKGDIWFSPYGGGIWRWDGKSVTNYPVKDEKGDTQVVRIFKDNGGVMWLGTPTAGPFRFSTEREAFEQFKP